MNPLITDTSIMAELQSLRRENRESFNGIVDKIVEGIEERIIDGFVKTVYEHTQAVEQRLNNFENKILNILLRTDEIARKSANSINVIVRLMAGAQKIKRDDLSKILIEAGALTDNVRSFSTDVNLEEISRNRFNLDLVRSNLLDLLKFTDILSGKKVNAVRSHSSFADFDPINCNVPSTSETHSTISQTSLVQNIHQDKSHPKTLSIITNLSNESGCENITVPSVIPYNTNTTIQKELDSPSTSATISTISQTSSIICNLSNNSNGEIMTVPSDSATNIKRQKELEEQETLRKRYRNKYSYLIKYKNKSYSTQNIDILDKNVNNKKISIQQSKDLNIPLNNVNKTNDTQNSVNSSTQCAQYCDPIFNGIENVEIAYIQEENNQNDKLVSEIPPFFTIVHPRIVLDKFDVDNFSLQKRLKNGISNSHQSNSSVIPGTSNCTNLTLKKKRSSR